MIFGSPEFLFVFLPLLLLLSGLIRSEKAGNLFIAICGLIFYAFGQLTALPLFLLTVLIAYFAGLALMRFGKKRVILIAAVGADLLILALFKYLPPLNSVLPLGISFFIFHGISYVSDIYREKAEPEKDFVHVLLYLSFFPRLIAGPIVRYEDFVLQLSERKRTPELAVRGILRFIVGLAKKMLIAASAGRIADAVFDGYASAAVLSGNPMDFRLAWLGAAAYAVQIYYDFSGYSDMAIGLSAVLGFRTAENFDFPYAALSLREFWRRWHISLSAWFREYLYIPLGGSRKGKLRAFLNRLLVFLCTGIWHGASWNYLLWGLGNGLLVSLEGAGVLPSDRLSKTRAGRVLCRVYTVFTFVILFALFRATSLAEGWKVISSMFLFRLAPDANLHLISLCDPASIVFLILGILLSGRMMLCLTGKLSVRMTERELPLFQQVGVLLGALLLFVLSLMSLASGGFAPFLYFQF